MRHKWDSGIDYGLVVLLPDAVRRVRFVTRASDPSRIQEAFLTFRKDGVRSLTATSQPFEVQYRIERRALRPTLRTGVGLKTMDLAGQWDYIAHTPYEELPRVLRATGFRGPEGFDWDVFWAGVRAEVDRVLTRVVVVHRINPFSPSTHLIGFYADTGIAPSNQMNVIVEPNPDRGQALCVILNSAIFLAEFFLLKEESTGRFINVRFYDLYEMLLSPRKRYVSRLCEVFDAVRGQEFPSLSRQLDTRFEERYQAFWAREDTGQLSLSNVLEQEVEPVEQRLELDLAVCRALGVRVTRDELVRVYRAIVDEMIITRRLRRD